MIQDPSQSHGKTEQATNPDTTVGSHQEPLLSWLETTQPWPSEPVSDTRRDATDVEKRRGEHTMDTLENAGMDHYPRINIVNEMGPMFVLGHATADHIQAQTKHVGPKTASKVPDADDFAFFTPDGWVANQPDAASPAITYSHTESATEVTILKRTSETFVALLSPSDYPHSKAIQLTPTDDASPREAIQIADVTIQFATDNGGYVHTEDVDEFKQKLPFKTTPPDPTSVDRSTADSPTNPGSD
jgi:hypothetical protein